MRFIIPTFLAFATSAYAGVAAVVLNNAPYPIYAWSVGATIGPRTKIAPGGMPYWEELHRDEKTGGVAIKLTKGENGLYNGEPQQIFSYNVDGDQVWYDLSSVFGSPFAGQRLEVTSDTGGAIVWKNGTHPGGSQVKVAKKFENIWLTIGGDDEN